MVKLVLVTFSHVDLSFVRELQDELGDQFLIYRFKHSDKWRNERKGLFRNVFQILKDVLCIVFKHKEVPIIIFGTSLCRLFFFLRKRNSCYYIFNELPSISGSIIGIFDKLVFKKETWVFVSSNSRKIILGASNFLIDNCEVLENITFTEIYPIEGVLETSTKRKAIFIGTIDASRFGTRTKYLLTDLIKTGIEVDILPSHTGNFKDLEMLGVVVLNPISNSEILDVLRNYNIGILSYEATSMNNYFSAPLKFYEYVNAGLKVLNLHENAGIDYFKFRFPSLFYDLSDNYIKYNEEFFSDRKLLLQEAIESNKKFSVNVLEELL